jgi:cytochrome b pre-mRNA-processing protein 3
MKAMLGALFRPNPRREAVDAAYGAIVARARDPWFYGEGGVPDTLEGRFELLALHAFLVLHRLRREPGAAQRFAQELFDTMFGDLDRSLREMGVGDFGIGRRVKALAAKFYGRIVAYESGLADPSLLAGALRRILYGPAAPSETQLASLTHYVPRQAAALAALPLASLLAGEVRFAPLEEGS